MEVGSHDQGVDKNSSRKREESKISEEVENGDSRGKKGDVVVDINDDNEGSNAEKLCRICHFSDDDSTEDSELIKLGCDCKGELGVSHRNCADAWFSQKGNRVCEICGKTAKNISSSNDDVSDSARLMMELSEMRLIVEALDSSDEGSRRCRMSFCNFLLGCLLLAFFLPWFFRGIDVL